VKISFASVRIRWRICGLSFVTVLLPAANAATICWHDHFAVMSLVITDITCATARRTSALPAPLGGKTLATLLRQPQCRLSRGNGCGTVDESGRTRLLGMVRGWLTAAVETSSDSSGARILLSFIEEFQSSRRLYLQMSWRWLSTRRKMQGRSA
jgi:hypothetical protein